MRHLQCHLASELVLELKGQGIGTVLRQRMRCGWESVCDEVHQEALEDLVGVRQGEWAQYTYSSGLSRTLRKVSRVHCFRFDLENNSL
jgi:hypothetical protein